MRNDFSAKDLGDITFLIGLMREDKREGTFWGTKIIINMYR